MKGLEFLAKFRSKCRKSIILNIHVMGFYGSKATKTSANVLICGNGLFLTCVAFVTYVVLFCLLHNGH